MTAYRRVGLGAIDQAVSSLGNILVIFALARVSTVSEFGTVSILFTAATAILAVIRGVFGTPIAILSDDRAALWHETRFSISAATAVGIIGGLLLAAGAWAADLLTIGTAIGVGLPVVVLQDVLRFHALSSGHPGNALASDGVWAAISALT